MKTQRRLRRRREVAGELPIAEATAATTPASTGDQPPAPAPHPKSVMIPGPHDAAGQRSAAKDVYFDRVAGAILSRQSQTFVKDTDGSDGARAFLAALRESVQPRDAVEEMLLLQMAWQHARLGRLSSIAGQQENRENLRVVNDACDRAANTFRRQVLALAEYRRPPRADAFFAIKQANLANQQVVQHVENQISNGGNATNEQGSIKHTAVPALAGGAGLTAALGLPGDAVATEHGAQDGGRQSAEQHERAEARRA